MSARHRLPRLLGALAAAVVLLLPGAGPALAADVTFGKPEYTSAFNERITFTVPFTASGPVERVEMRMQFPDALGPYINVVEPPQGGSGLLSYVLDPTGASHIVPNTTFEVTWAAYPDAAGDPILSEPLRVRYEDTAHDWRTLEGEVVRVHWYDGSKSFAQGVLDIGEAAVRETADLLGVTETDPIDFFIYSEQDAFQAALGPSTGENTVGRALAETRTMFALITSGTLDDPEVGRVVPHELVHLVFDTTVDNPYRFPPHWLNEGLATYLSEGYTRRDRLLVEQAAVERTLLPLAALTGRFPADPVAAFLAYAQSTSALDFLVKTYGKDALISLVKSYQEGLTDDEAFTKATGKDLAAFQAAWLADLGAAEPERYGPQPNPPGPVPPGWDQPLPPVQPGASPQAPGSTAQPGAPVQPPPGGVRLDGGEYTAPLALGIAAVFAVLFGILVLVRRRPEAS